MTMTMEERVEDAVKSDDYASLSEIFNKDPNGSGSGTMNSWESLGQGEQKCLSAVFVKAAMTSASFLPNAFASKSVEVIKVMKDTLDHLPPTVENGMDNSLRYKLFDHLVDDQDYRAAAHVLAGMRIRNGNGTDNGSGTATGNGNGTGNDNSNGNGNPYYMTPAQQTDVYVKIAECFLSEEDYVEADAFVTKAGTAVEAITIPNGSNDDETSSTSSSSSTILLILRYKSTYARVLDANRKFLQAAGRYYDLSQVGNQQSKSTNIDPDDLLEFLGRAARCAILAPSTAQRQRILALVCKDDRLSQLESIPHFATHASILVKMYMQQVITRDQDMIAFEDSLEDYQKAIMSDNLSIVQRALIEHNMVAISRLYSTIYIQALAQLLGLPENQAHAIASKMILDGSLNASIDQVDAILTFEDKHTHTHGNAHGNDGGNNGSGNTNTNASTLLTWDHAIESFCVQLNGVTDAVRQFA